MRAILGSYDSELTPAEYSPQLTRRMREAEDLVQKVHAHSSEMEVSAPGSLPHADLPPGWKGPRHRAPLFSTFASMCDDGGAQGRLPVTPPVGPGIFHTEKRPPSAHAACTPSRPSPGQWPATSSATCSGFVCQVSRGRQGPQSPVLSMPPSYLA